MAEKKTTANKSAKAKTQTKKAPAKKAAPKSIDWDKQPEEVIVIMKGKECKAYKGTAQILVESGKATLK